MPTKRQFDPEIQTVWFPEDGQEHGGLNKHSPYSRYVIKDTEYDDLINIMPLEGELIQVPSVGPLLSTIPGSGPIWSSAQMLNNFLCIFSLCSNGHIYQTNTHTWVTSDIGLIGGSTLFGLASDIDNWQQKKIIIYNSANGHIISWDGTTLTDEFNSGLTSLYTNICVFNSRLWIFSGLTVFFTAGGTYNSVGGDSGSFIITDQDCPWPIIAGVGFNGSLYLFGFSWVKVYSGFYDSGSPAVLQWSQQTLTSKAGTITKFGVMGVGYSLYYPSTYGIWNLFGAQPIMMSEAVDNFFQNLVPAVGVISTLSSAFAPILGVPCMMWLMQYSVDSSYRILCCTYHVNPEMQKWFTLELGIGNVNFITSGTPPGAQTPTAYAINSSGQIYQIAGGGSAVTSTVQTKLWSFGNRLRKKSVLRGALELITSVPTTVTMQAVDENLVTYTPDLTSPNPGSGNNYTLFEADLPITVRKLGLNITLAASASTNPSVAIGSFATEFEELPADFGA